MARFKFTLQRVLDRRLDEEEVKRRALATIERRRRELEDSLRARQGEISASRTAWRAGLVGEIDPAALRHHAAAGVGLFRKAQRTVIEIASLEKGIAKARAEAVEAARARRTLEILRDQRLSAFADGERRKEQGALDELGQQRAHAQTPNTHDGAVA
ncbi:MAG: Flagellar FliJ protein [Planctomycetota bacterium]|jgi:flagellar FliJ protein